MNGMNDRLYGLRQLIKHPGFTLVAVLTLGIGIGANTAIFSVVNAVLLKPLPFPASEQLVAFGGVDLTETGPTPNLSSLCYPDFFDFRNQNRSFSSMAVYGDRHRPPCSKSFGFDSENRKNLGNKGRRGLVSARSRLGQLHRKPQVAPRPGKVMVLEALR